MALKIELIITFDILYLAIVRGIRRS